MAPNSKVHSIALELEPGRNDDRLRVIFERYRPNRPEGIRLRRFRHLLRSEASAVRLFDIVNNPDARTVDIDLGQFGYLRTCTDVSQLQGLIGE